MQNEERVCVSVVVPAYNCKRTIEAAVSSVLAQTYPHFEILVVDDCSTDGTADCLRRLQQQDPRIKVLRNPVNSGVSFSRNNGVRHASCDWIAFLDGDDLWKEQKLARQMEKVRRQNADIVYTAYDFIGEKDRELDLVFHVPKQVTYRELLKQNVMSCSGILLRKSLLETYQMENDTVHEDYLEWLRLLRAGAKAVGIDEPLHTVRVLQEASKSSNKLRSAVMNYKTYRHLGHWTGDPQLYRSRETVEEWKRDRDPIKRMRERLIASGHMKEAELDKIEAEAKAAAEAAA